MCSYQLLWSLKKAPECTKTTKKKAFHPPINTEQRNQQWFSTKVSTSAISQMRISTKASATECRAGQSKVRQNTADKSGEPGRSKVCDSGTNGLFVFPEISLTESTGWRTRPLRLPEPQPWSLDHITRHFMVVDITIHYFMNTTMNWLFVFLSVHL